MHIGTKLKKLQEYRHWSYRNKNNQTQTALLLLKNYVRFVGNVPLTVQVRELLFGYRLQTLTSLPTLQFPSPQSSTSATGTTTVCTSSSPHTLASTSSPSKSSTIIPAISSLIWWKTAVSYCACAYTIRLSKRQRRHQWRRKQRQETGFGYRSTVLPVFTREFIVSFLEPWFPRIFRLTVGYKGMDTFYADYCCRWWWVDA